jgi:2-oxoglutarate/2-oxoacid ferredoxin oxidoreductase subunit alpha
MRFNILIGGQAGQGIDAASTVLARSLVKLGFYVFVYRDYGSLIRGGHNFNVISFSDQTIYSHQLSFDFAILLDLNSYKIHKEEFKKECIFVSEFDINEKNVVKVDANGIISKIKAKPLVKNSILLGAFFKALGLPIEPLLESIKEMWKDEKNLEAANEGYKNSIEIIKLAYPTKKTKRIFIDGTSAVGLAAIYYGLDLYFAYPMTPSTPLLHFLSSLRDKYDFKTIQLENEIAIANATLGASYAGAISMLGTSGGGFDLMTEAVSLQGMTEVPLVVYLGQRAGPSTGLPTYTMQADLNLALNCGHGEFARVVIAPGDSKDAFYKTLEAFYLAYKYGVVSIILSDKHLAESWFTFDIFEEPKIKGNRFIFENVENFKTYEITKDFIPRRTVPEIAMVKVNSYEHDEFGFTTEDKEITRIMQEKRKRKFEVLEKEVKENFEMVKTFGNGENLIIGFGSTKGAILDALPFLKNCRYLQIIYLSPFPEEIVKKEIENSKNVIIVENNSTGQLGRLIREKVGIEAREVLKYDGRPFTQDEIIEKVNNILNGG